MSRNVSLSMTVLSLLGMGFTFQMAEDAMNKDIDWMMEAGIVDYVNPLALGLCFVALALSLGCLAFGGKSARRNGQKAGGWSRQEAGRGSASASQF